MSEKTKELAVQETKAELNMDANEATIKNLIYVIRGQQVMLDSDLAMLYQVKTRILNQAVKRNILRFPETFRFQLNKDEFINLKSQFVISSCPIYVTVWWALVSEKKNISELSYKQRETIKRIQGEPESIIPKEE